MGKLRYNNFCSFRGAAHKSPVRGMLTAGLRVGRRVLMAKQQKSYYGGYCLGPCLRQAPAEGGLLPEKRGRPAQREPLHLHLLRDGQDQSRSLYPQPHRQDLRGVHDGLLPPGGGCSPVLRTTAAGGGRRRKSGENAWRIGDLTSPEREVIGYLRDKRISAQELLDELRRAYDNLPEDSDEKK